MSAAAKDPLKKYRAKRDSSKTPEPVPAAGDEVGTAAGRSFVIQEHHARALHWDFRLERDGVLVSWAIPKGLPTDRQTNHLAVRTEDHPLEYGTFEGSIPAGQYGGGRVAVWDAGVYDLEKWREDEVMVVLHGKRASGKFVLFRTGGDQWMIHRMDDPPKDWTPLPELVKPMLATAGELPTSHEEDWAYEMKWDGVRAVVYVDGGRARVMTRNDRDVSASYPELDELAESLGSRQVVLDGEIVAFDDAGRPSFSLLQRRMHVAKRADARRLAASDPAVYLAFDLLHLDGRALVDLTYDERRHELESLGLDGPRWNTPPAFTGRAADALATSSAQGLEGVVAKRRASTYSPGRRSPSWIKVKHARMQEVVIGGWTSGRGARDGRIGALLMGVHDENGALMYAGKVGTGFGEDALADLQRRLGRLTRKSSPFGAPLPREVQGATFVTPRLVGEVAFTEWTPDGQLRHPAWRGLRPDKSAGEVVRE